MKGYRTIPVELIFWLLALIFLWALGEGIHFPSLCPSQWFGLKCPGCGIGRSVALLLRGELIMSIQQHPLGIILLPLLAERIVFLYFQFTKPNYHPILPPL